jgi:hypothetical protein
LGVYKTVSPVKYTSAKKAKNILNFQTFLFHFSSILHPPSYWTQDEQDILAKNSIHQIFRSILHSYWQVIKQCFYTLNILGVEYQEIKNFPFKNDFYQIQKYFAFLLAGNKSLLLFIRHPWCRILRKSFSVETDFHRM